MTSAVFLTAVLVGGTLLTSAGAQTRPGVAPKDAWTCPATHPIKGNFTPVDPREICIYHVPGGAWYDRTKPERCYATADDARKDRCRASNQ